MPRTIPLVSIGILRPFVDALEAAGFNSADVLRRAEISLDDLSRKDALIHTGKVSVFLDACSQITGNHRFCSDVGASMDPKGWPMLQAGKKHARSLADFICIYLLGANRISSSIEAYLVTQGEFSLFGQKRFVKPKIKPAQNDAFMAGLYLAILERHCGAFFRAEQVTVVVSDPLAVTKKYSGCHFIKGNDVNHYVQFPTEWLVQSAIGEDILAPDLVPPGKDFLTMLRLHLRQEVSKRPVNARGISRFCGMSQSALKRKLASLGTDFSTELSHARLHFAQEQLTETDASINEISNALGYSNVSNFNRAFRKMTGLSPAEFRTARDK